jgi:hypothetical protein
LFDFENFQLKIITKKIQNQIKSKNRLTLIFYISTFFEQHHRAKQEEEEEEVAKISIVIVHWEERREFVTCNKTRGVSHCDLAIYIKKYLNANSNISPSKNVIFKKNPLKETKILQDIITLELISSFNTSQKYHLSNILI